MSVITMEQIIKSNTIKKETCNKCKDELQNIFSPEQLSKFEEIFYSVSKDYLFSRKEN